MATISVAPAMPNNKLAIDRQSEQPFTARFPVHARRPEGYSQEPFSMGSIAPLLGRLSYEGPSVTVLPSGELRCGARQGMSALRASRRGNTAASAINAGGGGLLLIHSHSQTLTMFEAHARMLSLLHGSRITASAPIGTPEQMWSRPPGYAKLQSEQRESGPPRLLNEASLLLITNNGPEALRPLHGSAKRLHGERASGGLHASRWLQLYTLPLRIRMLITTSFNVGYMCGEFDSPAHLQYARICTMPFDCSNCCL